MNRIIEIIWNDVTIFGSFVFYIFLTALMFGLREYNLSLQLLIAFVISFMLTFGIRLFYHKERPKKQEYKNIIEKLDASSFPSLHSMRAVILLVLFFLQYKSLVIALIFGVLALIVFASRYYLKKHYILDIIVGVMFGVLIGYAVSFIRIF